MMKRLCSTVDGAPPIVTDEPLTVAGSSAADMFLDNNASSTPHTTRAASEARHAELADSSHAPGAVLTAEGCDPLVTVTTTTATDMVAANPTCASPLIAPALQQRILPDDLIVYTRTPRTLKGHDAATSAVTEFIGKISKPVEALVPTPAVKKRRKKTMGPVSMPRRSRRLANLPPETDRASASTFCRKLGLTDEDGRISDEALARYSKFYNHLLGRVHVTALSALFGWDVPPDGQAEITEISVSVI